MVSSFSYLFFYAARELETRIEGSKQDPQDLKSCEGFPREGSSPSPGTLKSVIYAISES